MYSQTGILLYYKNGKDILMDINVGDFSGTTLTAELTARVQAIKDLMRIQGSNGHWDYDPYNHGLYNGLAIALGILDGKQEKYLRNSPKEWISSVNPQVNRSEISD